MNENMNNKNPNQIYFDYTAMAKQFAEQAIVEFVGALMLDEKTRKLMIGMLKVHRKYGIDPVTSMNMIQDYAKVFTEDEE